MRSTITSTRRPGLSKPGHGSVATRALRRSSSDAASWRVIARRGVSAQSARLGSSSVEGPVSEATSIAST